jgi:hypothetical protein
MMTGPEKLRRRETDLKAERIEAARQLINDLERAWIIEGRHRPEPDLDLFKRIDDDLNPSSWVRWGVGLGCALMGAFFVTASWLAYALFWG